MADSKNFEDLTVEELSDKEKELRKELFNLRFQAVSGHVENPNRVKQIKRDIARILTFSQMKRKEAAAKEAASK
ncbi:MAG: 50S ribosomal protein L29 [Candidatus Manganitrophaceae bacterium]|nr:MAG: 50S ribosomal protein L29 [Candidatus Manganitrophaceae bacterium]